MPLGSADGIWNEIYPCEESVLANGGFSLGHPRVEARQKRYYCLPKSDCDGSLAAEPNFLEISNRHQKFLRVKQFSDGFRTPELVFKAVILI